MVARGGRLLLSRLLGLLENRAKVHGGRGKKYEVRMWLSEFESALTRLYASVPT